VNDTDPEVDAVDVAGYGMVSNCYFGDVDVVF
jgi:hypothetical protein